ncbi:hypothetical protein [Bacteroides graminisolvens]|uniref:PIN domain-containing protein n=1 Tax=Bacteroides graminisolvens DSM 19988 = JCM 15093 TaxID=1121097 RepID=A0A069D4P9_9BACE|nr:hypothetical protein [Bacteroides graminisolvens]GAK37276.1 hypothetical protein JCM15093_2518 [Bacteroides graminisolvens DSM 19988 = JCM 15093]
MSVYVDDKFRINIFLDTNILIDVLDGTFTNLNHSINFLISSDFVTLKSSHYVMFEMVENRKWNHFAKEVVRHTGTIESVRKKYNWKINGIKYSDHKENIQQKVLIEKEKIVRDFTIIWEENVLHNELLAPTLDLCLESTISREDSLVLLSSVFPKERQKEEQVLLMSRDKEFNKSCNEIDIKSIFSKHDIYVPEMIKTGCLFCNKYPKQINLNASNQHTKSEIEQFWKQKIIETIVNKNKESFLGYTYSFKLVAGKDCVFFKLAKKTFLHNNIGLIIIGKDLDFIYSTYVISDFWNNEKIDNYPLVDDNNELPISFKPYDKDDKGNMIEFQNLNLLSKMREKGNLVFVNDDL